MDECVGMDWHQERNEGVYICTVLALHNCSMLNFNNHLESMLEQYFKALLSFNWKFWQVLLHLIYSYVNVTFKIKAIQRVKTLADVLI